MPELSNAGSSSRTSRSARSNTQLQTRAGATAKVQIRGHELPTQNSQAIMSGGLAQANAVGNVGKAISGFFNTIEEVDSNLIQVERAETLRVASEAQQERRKVANAEAAEVKYQERKAENKAEQQAAQLAAAVNIGVQKSTVNALFNGFNENVIRTFDVMSGESMAKKADEFYDANFVSTGDLLLDQKINNAWEEKIFPELSLVAENRNKEVRSKLATDLSSEIQGRTQQLFARDFADDFDRLKAIAPEMGDSKVSANILSMYKESAQANGKWKEFSRFISEAKIIKTDKGFKTFAEQFASASAEILDKGFSEFQAQNTIESQTASSDLITSINTLAYGPDNEAELADLTLQQIQFSNQYGDSTNSKKITTALDAKTIELGKMAAAESRWDALHRGTETNLKTETFNLEELPRLLSNPGTNFLNPDLSPEEYSAVSTAVAGIIKNHHGQMGMVSKKVRSAISGMMSSPDEVMNLRGYTLLQKLDTLDSSMSSRILEGNANSSTLYDAYMAGSITPSIIGEDVDLKAQLIDPDLVSAQQNAAMAHYEVKTPTAMFKAITADSNLLGVPIDNPHMEAIASYLNVSDDNIFINPNGKVAKEFLSQLTALSIANDHNGLGLDQDGLAEAAWAKVIPNLDYERKTNGRFAIIMKSEQVALPDPLSSLTDGGENHTQMYDSDGQINPYDKTKVVNARTNMDNSVTAIGNMNMLVGSGAGWRKNDDGTGTFTVTQTNSVTGMPEDIILGVGAAYDLGSQGSQPTAIEQRYGITSDLKGTSKIDATVELTGDPILDNASLEAIKDSLPESMHLVPIYPAGTSKVEREDGSVKALGYKMRVYPHMSKSDIPENMFTDEEMKELGKGGHVDPKQPRPAEYQGFDKRPNKDHNWQLDQTITKDRLPFTNFSSQSDLDHSAMIQEGVINELKIAGAVSPLVGLTKPLQAGLLPDGAGDALAAGAENVSWFIQDAYMKVKEHMGTDSNPEYNSQRFEMIAEREAWRAGSYWDGVKKANGGKGYRTVGYGYNLDSAGHKDLFKEILQVGDDYYASVYSGDVDITEAQGRKLFDAAVGEAESIIDNRLEGVDLNHQQRLALVSMAYNSPKLIGKNLVSQLKSGDMEGAVQEILYKSNGTRMLGLYNRRYEEALTFVGANRANGIPSYLSYMADVLPEKYAAKFAASQGISDVVKGTS